MFNCYVVGCIYNTNYMCGCCNVAIIQVYDEVSKTKLIKCASFKASEQIEKETMTCEYCNPDMSHGNKGLIEDDTVRVYIVRNVLYALREDAHIAIREPIKHCPMCGKKLQEVSE